MRIRIQEPSGDFTASMSDRSETRGTGPTDASNAYAKPSAMRVDAPLVRAMDAVLARSHT